MTPSRSKSVPSVLGKPVAVEAAVEVFDVVLATVVVVLLALVVVLATDVVVELTRVVLLVVLTVEVEVAVVVAVPGFHVSGGPIIKSLRDLTWDTL